MHFMHISVTCSLRCLALQVSTLLVFCFRDFNEQLASLTLNSNKSMTKTSCHLEIVDFRTDRSTHKVTLYFTRITMISLPQRTAGKFI